MKATLTEFAHRELELETVTVEFLQRVYEKELELLPRGGGLWRVRALHYVGSIVAPGLELRIRPKCGTRNLFHLLSRAYRLANLRRELIDQEEVEDLREFLLAILVRRIEDLVQMGMRREYIEQEERIGVLRGRLLLDPLLRSPAGVALTLPCRFEEFTTDVVHNRVLRYALERLDPPRDPELGGRFRRMRRAFQTVSLQPIRPSQIDELRYNRLNAHYEPLHQLCRLLLEASGLEQDAGTGKLSSFLIDMDRVFETFVADWLDEHLPRPLALSRQWTGHLDLERHIGMRPDLLVHRRGTRLLVGDTKYKEPPGSGASAHDAYQVLGYCRSLGLRTGVLIYPGAGQKNKSFAIAGDNRIVAAYLPLSGTVEEIEGGMGELLKALLFEISGDGTSTEWAGRASAGNRSPATPAAS